MITAGTEALEPRRLLSGYALHTLASFASGGPLNPEGTVVHDAAGDLFGIAASVASGNTNGGIYEVPAGSSTPTLIAAFPTGTVPATPNGLVIDSSGNIFGTLDTGGDANNDGIIFELPKGGRAIQTLAEFTSATTGAGPEGSIAIDSSGNLYGATQDGGANHAGTVWEYNVSSQALTALGSFPTETTAEFGSEPSDVVLAGNGNLYGSIDGNPLFGDYGSVWELPSGSSTVNTIATFNETNGSVPEGSLVVDSNGNVFGATQYGGAFNNGGTPQGLGTVYEIGNDSGTATDIASFDGTDGQYPQGGVVADSSGDLIGVASAGDDTTNYSPGEGDVFELIKGTTTITPIANFNNTDGRDPVGTLSVNSSGDLFGTTYDGGASQSGTAFELTPSTAGGGGGGGSGSLTAALSATAPATGVSGQRIKASFTATLTDGGSSLFSETVGTQLFLSTDGTIDADSIAVTPDVARKIKLKAAAHTHYSVRLTTIPATVPAGAYQWIEQITESGGTDDAVAAQQITVAAPQVDLSGSFAKFADSAKAGKKFTEVISVENTGNVTAFGTLPIVVETSPDQNPADATELATINKKVNIGTAKSEKISLSLNLPLAGSYFLIVELDPQKTLADDISLNNIFASAAAVIVG